MLYKGSCHCGKVAFEFKAELTGAIRCNCSICTRKGALLCAIPHETLRVLAWGDDLGTYTFGNHAIAHRFCRACGIHPFAEDVREAVNAAPISTSTAWPISTLRPCRSSLSTGGPPDAIPGKVRSGFPSGIAQEPITYR